MAIHALFPNFTFDFFMFRSSANSFFLEYRPADSVEVIYSLTIDYFGGGHASEDFPRVIEVPSDLSLIKLHLLLQHVTGIDDAQIDAFYLASNLRGAKIWYKRNGAWMPENQPGLNLPIHEIFSLRSNRKLFYSFNFGGGRVFRLAKISAGDTPVPERKYPRVVQHKEMAPTL